MKKFGIVFIFSLQFLLPLAAQSGTPGDTDILEQEYRKESLRDLALESISKGSFKEALAYLDAAIALAPYETELQDLRLSVLDIVVLTEGNDNTSNTDINDPNFTEFYEQDKVSEEIISPDFARELLTQAQLENPEVKRNAFSLSFGGSYGSTRPVNLQNGFIEPGEGSIPIHPFNRLILESQYFFKESVRQFGVSTRLKGTVVNQDHIDMLAHRFDVSFHYRGFFAETMENRLILGAKAGLGYLYFNELDDNGQESIRYHGTTILGIYFEDAVLRYLLKDQFIAKRFILGINFDFFYLDSLENVNMTQFSISGGYKISDRWFFGIFNEVTNSTNDLQSTNSWELGGQLKYSF